MLKTIKKSRFIISIMFCILFATFANASTRAGLVVSLYGDAWVERGKDKITLKIKSPIQVHDKIVTSKNGKVQILFEDDTSLSVGNNSSVSIDNFVFNTNQKPQFGAKVFKGISRVITGQIVEQNENGFTLSTPLATAGIRGTILTAIVRGDIDTFQLNQIGFGREVIIKDIQGKENILDTTGYSIDISLQAGVGVQRETTQQEVEQTQTQLIVKSDTTSNSSTTQTATNENSTNLPNSSETVNDTIVADNNTETATNTSPNTGQVAENESGVDNDKFTNQQDSINSGIIEDEIADNRPPDVEEPVRDISGSYFGHISSNDSSTGKIGYFNFDVNLQSGAISDANMKIANTGGANGTLGNGSGTVSLGDDGNANIAISDFENIDVSGGLPGNDATDANMNGTINAGDNITSGDWEINFESGSETGSFVGGKDIFDDLNEQEFINNFEQKREMSGNYSGNLNDGDGIYGIFNFNVDLLNGTIQHANMVKGEATRPDFELNNGNGTIGLDSSGNASFEIGDFIPSDSTAVTGGNMNGSINGSNTSGDWTIDTPSSGSHNGNFTGGKD